mmetsp:Transcript_6226/g.25803  ORF Transcript_6226/g.25803 Transcript_6226/m.25803 type:complete len:203 (-) Transcript_6226:827-1435(-)
MGRPRRRSHGVCPVDQPGADPGADARGDEDVGAAAAERERAVADHQDGHRRGLVRGVVRRLGGRRSRERRGHRGIDAHKEPDVVRLALRPPRGADDGGAVPVAGGVELHHDGGARRAHGCLDGCVVFVLLRRQLPQRRARQLVRVHGGADVFFHRGIVGCGGERGAVLRVSDVDARAGPGDRRRRRRVRANLNGQIGFVDST